MVKDNTLCKLKKKTLSEPSFTYLDHCQLRTYNKGSASFDYIALKMTLYNYQYLIYLTMGFSCFSFDIGYAFVSLKWNSLILITYDRKSKVWSCWSIEISHDSLESSSIVLWGIEFFLFGFPFYVNC